MVAAENPLDFLLHPDGAETVIDAAYRNVRQSPVGDVILFGTGNPDHVKSNIASILKGPLPDADTRQLEAHFRHLIGFGCDFPEAKR